MSTTDQPIIDLPDIKLPRDLARRVKFFEAVEDHLRLLGVNGRFVAPRFFGYYFAGRHPVVLARHWKVTLDSAPLLSRLRQFLEQVVGSRFSIVAEAEERAPDYLLVHDGFDGSCWLWGFEQGRRFLEACDPVRGGELCADDDGRRDGDPRLLGG